MPTFGVNPDGFRAPTFEEELALIEADQRANISQTLDLSENSVLGKVNRILAERNIEAWTALKAIHDGADPKLATADAATSLAKITNTNRAGASFSEVPVTVTLEKGTKLIAGQHFGQVTGKPALRWTPKEDLTADADGSFTTRWRAELPGPSDTPVNSIGVIVTPVVGWIGITASGEVAIGHDVDDDADLHERREQALARAGSGTTAAIRSDLLGLPGATSCQVFENETDDFDPVTGLPPHSFEAIIWADDSSDDEIAQALWNTRSSSIPTVGASSGTAHDAEGRPQVMRFTRPAQLEIWITYQVVRLGDYVGDEASKETIATRLDASLKAGMPVCEYDLLVAAHGLGVKVKAIAFGLAPAPTAKVEIPIGTRQIARFDAGRVVLT